MKALLHGSQVIQVEETEFPVAEPLKWVDAPVGTTTECTYDEELGIVFPAAPTLDDIREAKYAEIRAAFARVAVEPIRDAAGVEWHGGYESAQRLDGAWRLAERSGLAEVIFYDTGNVGHTLPLAAADEVVKLVAAKYQQDFGYKQGLMVVAATAGSAAELEFITWEPGAA